METLSIDATDETPAVDLNPSNGQLAFTGKSLPEDVTQFYNPILDWLEQYSLSPQSSTVLTSKFTYFNTASSKCILDILLKLEEIQEDGHTVKVNWCFQEDDEDMEEAGEEYSEIVDIPFDMQPYSG